MSHSIKDLYISEKDREFKKKKKIVYLQGDDIGYREVEGNRKDISDQNIKNEFLFLELEKKMRFRDIIKQYKLFFNKKFKLYSRDYIESLVKLLDNNEKDYLEKRKQLSLSRKKIKIFHSSENLNFNSTSNYSLRKNIQSSGINSPKSLMIDNSDKEIVNLNSKRKNKNKDKIIPCIKLERLKKKIKLMNNNEFQLNKKKFKLQNYHHSKRFFVGKLTKKTDSFATIDINNNETITSNENKIKEEKNFNIINLKRNSKSNLLNNIMRRSNSSNSFFDENLKENSILYQRLTGRTFFRKGTIKTIDAMKSNPLIFQKPYSFLGDFIKNHEGFKN